MNSVLRSEIYASSQEIGPYLKEARARAPLYARSSFSSKHRSKHRARARRKNIFSHGIDKRADKKPMHRARRMTDDGFSM